MLQTIKSSKNLPLLINVAEHNEIGIVGVGGNCEDETVKKLLLTSKNLNRSTDYLTPKAKLAFIQLKKAFTEAWILQHFDLESHIQIETDAPSYAIGRVLSQLTLDDSGQWHLVAFYSQKMILAKTWYKTHNSKLLAIVEAFKIWKYYLKSCKHKVFVLINHNNLCRFMNTKSLSSRQVC